MPTSRDYARMRARMVDEQLVKRGINDRRVLDSMRTIARHEFVPKNLRQTPMKTDPCQLVKARRFPALYRRLYVRTTAPETRTYGTGIGTGSGYQTAILCELTKYVYSMERNVRLADVAAERIALFGHNNIDIHVGDGSQGLPDQARFDRIIVTAAVPRLPTVLCTQLEYHDGRMILPVGDQQLQELKLVTRQGENFTTRTLLRCRFVPLIGRYGFSESIDDDIEIV